MASGADATAHRVVIVGCGFGGLEAVRVLARDPRVDITLIDRTNHHLFQPLLYQVATAGLAAPAISAPIRHVLRREMARGRLTVLRAEVVDLDPVARAVVLDDGVRLPYDDLVVAAGATHSYFGHDDWSRHAPGLKTLADAFDIRERIIGAFERAERTDDLDERAAWLSFAIVGAGPTGVELAGTLVEIARHTLPQEFRRIDSRRTRVVLMEGSPRVLGAFDERLSDSARRQLEAMGVEVRCGCQVTAIDPDGLTFIESGGAPQRLPARTVVWAAGVQASPLGRVLAERAGAVLDRTGRVVVEVDLGVPARPEIHVIGDLASATTPTAQGTRPVPGVSPAAKQMGRLVARNIRRRLDGRPAQAFRYRDYGTLATIGRKAAVVQLALPGALQLRFSGWFAWVFWLFAHIWFLIGYRNRLVVLIDWAWSYWTFARHARVVAQRDTFAPPPLPTDRTTGDHPDTPVPTRRP